MRTYNARLQLLSVTLIANFDMIIRWKQNAINPRDSTFDYKWVYALIKSFAILIKRMVLGWSVEHTFFFELNFRELSVYIPRFYLDSPLRGLCFYWPELISSCDIHRNFRLDPKMQDFPLAFHFTWTRAISILVSWYTRNNRVQSKIWT